MRKQRLSWEGIPYNEYHWMSVLLCLVPGVLMTLLLNLLALTCREKKTTNYDVPERAIIFAYHIDMYASMASASFWEKWRRDFIDSTYYLAFHGPVSYAACMWAFLRKMKCFRFDRSKGTTAREQVMDFLEAHDDVRFFLRTDSGGPYGKVRKSIVRMALEFNRPVVGISQKPQRYIKIYSHLIPIPFLTTVEPKMTRVFLPSEFNPNDIDGSVAKLQAAMDALRN